VIEKSQFPKNLTIALSVHNAWSDTLACLESVWAQTPPGFQLRVIDDGSSAEVASYLNDYCARHPSIVLLRNEIRRGYTYSVNRLMKDISTEFFVLLNSDLILPPEWWCKVSEAFASSARVGIVGAWSNAAAWFSVPKARRRMSGWTFPGEVLPTTYDQISGLIQEKSAKKFPKIPFVNGFFLAFRSKLFQEVGILDEVNFPEGYGAEIDYCFRASEKGFEVVLADHLYIYHRKSASTSLSRRKSGTRRGDRALLKKYGFLKLGKALLELRGNRVLRAIRREVRDARG